MLRAGCCCAAAVAPSIRTSRTPAAIGRAIRFIGDLREARSYRTRVVTGILPATEFRAARDGHGSAKSQIPNPKTQIKIDTLPVMGRRDSETQRGQISSASLCLRGSERVFGIWSLGFGIWDL